MQNPQPDAPLIKPSELKPSTSPDEEIDVDEGLKKARAQLSFNEEQWLYRIRIILIGIMVLVTVAVLVIFLLHLVLPDSCRWLTAPEVEGIKGVAVTIAGGLIMSGATAYFFKKKD